MANYTVEQACKMIDDCFTPEYLMMEKAIERQYYVDIFTEMHNYISENIIELPFDAEVFTEEDQKDNVETKNVWDKNDKGWGGFWRNVGRVIVNIWKQFWALIRSLVGQKDYVKSEEAQKIADKAEAVAKDLEQKSEQEVEKAVAENPEPVKEAVKDIKDITVLLKEAFSKVMAIHNKAEATRAKVNAFKNKKFKQIHKDASLKFIDKQEAEQKEKELESIIPELDKIIANPSEFKDKKGLLLGFLKSVNSTINPATIDLENKLCNSLKSQIIAAMMQTKLDFEVISKYPKQSQAVQSNIITWITSYFNGGVIFLQDAADAAINYTLGSIDKYTQPATITKGSKTITGTKKVLNPSEIDNIVADIKTTIDNVNNTFTKLITANNISDIDINKYKIDFDENTGIIKNINQMEPLQSIDLSNSNIQTTIVDIKQIIDAGVSASATASQALISMKSKNDRKIASLINDAINKLQSLT